MPPPPWDDADVILGEGGIRSCWGRSQFWLSLQLIPALYPLGSEPNWPCSLWFNTGSSGIRFGVLEPCLWGHTLRTGGVGLDKGRDGYVMAFEASGNCCQVEGELTCGPKRQRACTERRHFRKTVCYVRFSNRTLQWLLGQESLLLKQRPDSVH